VFLLILAHVDTGHHRFVVEQKFCQCLCQFGFTYTSRTQEEERTNRPFGILQPGTATADSVGNGFDGFILTDDTLVEFFFQMEEFFLFALQHLADRYSRPARYNVGYVFGIYLFLNHGLIALHGMQFLLGLFYFLVQCLKLAVTDFGYFAVIALAFSFFGFEFQVFDFDLVLLNLVYQRLFALPFGFVRAFLFFEFGQFLTDLFQFGFVVLALDGFALDFQLLYFTRNFVQLFRYGVYFHTQFGCCFIHQVDGLIGQETVGNVSVTQLDCGNDGIVFDTYVVMVFVTFFQSTQNRDGAQRIRFVDHNSLESTFQRLVLLEIFLIFVEGCSTDASQFATSQCRLQYVGSIHSPFAFASTYQCVDFVDEKDDVTFRLFHFVDNGF